MDDGSRQSAVRITAAGQIAEKAGKRLAVIFGADWCPDARALDAALLHPLVAPILEEFFEVVPVDVGNRDKNLEMMAQYGMRPEAGIPAVAFLEADGSLVQALRDGELRRAREMSPLEIAEIFHQGRKRR